MGREMGMRKSLMELLPFVAMVMLEVVDVGLTTIGKVAMSRGLSHFIFVVYSNAIATVIMLALSLIFFRAKRPPVTFNLICKFFCLSLVGITLMQNCILTGVNYSSPTLGSAIGQMVPAFTFVLAVIFRMEKLDLRSSRSQIKILATLVSISGALIVILYKGSPIGPKSDPEPNSNVTDSSMNSWVLGGIFLAIGSLSLSVFNTFQAMVLKEYPSEMTIVSFYCLFGTIQCAIVSLIAERDLNAWKLRPDIELISVIYSAVFGNVVTYGLVTWCIRKKGPVFVAMFKPLGIAIAAFLGVIFLGDTLHVGSIIGAAVIVTGFYGVIWAQSKEQEEAEVNKLNRPGASSDDAPLLDSHLR